MKTIIIDDEQNARENLTSLIQSYCPNIVIVKTSDSVSDAINSIRSYKPDLIFLDIELNEGTGFDVLEAIKDIPIQVIFITAFNQYAIKAFKFSAIDYLLKPIDIDELKEAISRAESKFKKQEINKQIDSLLSLIKNQSEKETQKIILPISGGFQFYDVNEIIRVQSQSNYVTFYLIQERELLISKTLKEFEEILEKHGLIRVHHSHIVNPNFILQYQKNSGGYLVLKDQTTIPLSKSYKDKFNDYLNKLS